MGGSQDSGPAALERGEGRGRQPPPRGEWGFVRLAWPEPAWGAAGGADVPLSAGGSALPTALLLSALLGLALALGLCCARRAGLHKHLCQLGKGTSCQYR